MPRAGLDPAVVVAAAAGLADEIGLADVTMSRVAQRLGVRTPPLYKHVSNQADLNRRIAALALTEVGDALRDALQGRSGPDALAAAAHTIRAYVRTHPGRYATTIRPDAQAPRALGFDEQAAGLVLRRADQRVAGALLDGHRLARAFGLAHSAEQPRR